MYEVSKETRKSFIQWLDEVSLNYKDDLRWMLSAPAVRNTYNSDLFLNVCYYKVLEAYLKEEKDIDFIFVDSPALARLIKTNYSSRVQYSRFNSFLSFFCYVKLFLKFILRFFRYLFDYG
ncbi:MAG: hypothetical protein KAR31_10235, partial [Candidatus Omnitrophica bacterium]|nr:hypothetical protein [Candidatus Omnitrophota bacterium]